MNNEPARKRIFFICTANQHRSRTAEDLEKPLLLGDFAPRNNRQNDP